MFRLSVALRLHYVLRASPEIHAHESKRKIKRPKDAGLKIH